MLADACLALAAGELAQRHDAYRDDISEERYVLRCRLKTASLFAAACRLGALAAGRPPAESEALEAFGQDLGIAFQMLDDLLDVSGPAARTGKHRGTDLLDGTVTLPLILAREQDPALAALDLREVSTRERAEEVCDRIAATDALDSHARPRRRAGGAGEGRSARPGRRPARERAALGGRPRRRPVRLNQRLRRPNREPPALSGRRQGGGMLGGRFGPEA